MATQADARKTRRRNTVTVVGVVLSIGATAAVGAALWGLLRTRNLPSEATIATESAPPPTGGRIKWVGCDISRASFIDAAVAAYSKKTGNVIEIEDGGATRGIRDVSAGSAHMGGSCRTALDIPEERGVKLIPIAWDALVVVVHPTNPVSDISLEQLRDVLEGSITNWKDLGGSDAPLDLFDRKGKLSGVGAGTRLLLFGDIDKDFSARARIFDSTRPLEEAAETSPLSIAVTGISSARLRKLKMLSLEGKAPTRDNVIRGQYLLYRPLYITVPNEPDPIVTDFVNFLFSSDGEQIIHDTGTVTMAEGADLWAKYKSQVGADLGAGGP
ncbi:MAG: phosphate ABC transporter substrate-binding protein [Polyangiaceae bacterium]|nr:phosphate ABC transporter substrate-binding protein [Polyangiaceae bacterium]